jgi:hypothetical protein
MGIVECAFTIGIEGETDRKVVSGMWWKNEKGVIIRPVS